jgi:hypothetical protein
MIATTLALADRLRVKHLKLVAELPSTGVTIFRQRSELGQARPARAALR